MGAEFFRALDGSWHRSGVTSRAGTECRLRRRDLRLFEPVESRFGEAPPVSSARISFNRDHKGDAVSEQWGEADFYADLSILPDAEASVITAAYRALAAKYHPDKWAGDPKVAHERMSRINRAYGVLSESKQRAAYDKHREQQNSRASYEQQEEDEEAFDSALNELEARWEVALGVFPELADLRRTLSRTSHQLAFGFVATLLGSRQFERAAEIAQKMEAVFLQRFFGSDPEILKYVKSLIDLGAKDAVKGLNQLVDVLGSDVKASRLIERIDEAYKIPERIRAAHTQKVGKERAEAERREAESAARERADRIYMLKTKVLQYSYVREAQELATMLGYCVEEEPKGWFGSTIFKLSNPNSADATVLRLPPVEFVGWVAQNLAMK